MAKIAVFKSGITILLILGIGILIIGLGLNKGGISQEKPPPAPESKPIKIGVVNIAKTFEKYKKREEYEILLMKEREKEELKMQEIEKEIKTLMEEIEALDESSELRHEKAEQLAIFSARREYLTKNWNEWLKRRINKHTATLYNEIREAIDQYAQAHGFTLILKSETPRLDKIAAMNATEQISFRSLLYWGKGLDITDEIIKLLNK